MLGLLLRGFFLLGIISLYSHGVWKFINEYFRNEFETYLREEFKRNKHLQPAPEIPTQLPPTTIAPEDLNELSSEKVEHFIRRCDEEFEKELDYHNHPATNDRQRRDDDGFINYWLERKSRDNDDNNLHCRQEATNCQDNRQWSACFTLEFIWPT